MLISYEGKCKPGTFRLGVIREVTVDPDNLVRTVLVEYSLLGHVPFSERYKYEGITKKKITVQVQRLVLILSAEEQNNLPGGQTCKSAVPLEEVHADRSLSSGVDCGQIEVASVSAVLKSGLREELKLSVKSCRILEWYGLREVKDTDGLMFSQLFGGSLCCQFTEIS